MKVIQKAKVNEHEIYATLMKQELEVLEEINHPYVVRVLDLFEDSQNIYVAMEILNDGNLMDYLYNIFATR